MREREINVRINECERERKWFRKYLFMSLLYQEYILRTKRRGKSWKNFAVCVFLVPTMSFIMVESRSKQERHSEKNMKRKSKEREREKE